MSTSSEPGHSRPAPVGGRALVLGGGGLLGAMYEIGCLAALERAGALPAFDLYVGTSGGSVVAALLAAGYRPSELLSMAESFSPANLSRLDLTAFLRATVRLSSQVAGQFLTGMFRRRPWLSETLALLQTAVPAGLLNLDPLVEFLQERIRVRGLEDTFEALPHPLYVPAIDLDTGERIVFGHPDYADAKVSTAVAASCAIPRFFRPVSVGDRDLIDGGIADALNLDVALERGVGEALVVNPLVAPLNDRDSRCLPSPNGNCGHVAEQGLVVVLGQAIKISHMTHSRMSFKLYQLTYPGVVVEVIQPDRLEVDLDNPMDFRGRARLLARGEMDGTRFATLRSNARRPQANGQHRRRVRGEGTYLPDKRDRRRSSG